MRRWDEAPAEMAAAPPVHDAIVREAIEGHGGHVFATTLAQQEVNVKRWRGLEGR